MVDGGIGISAVVAVGSKFIERSKFPGRHDAIYDKEVDKSIKLAERFDNIPREDVDHFEFEEYTMLRSKSLQDLRHYRDTQEEYKQKEWFRDPIEKYHSRGRVRQAKRRVQSSATQEGRHVDDLETYSRSNSSRCSSVASFVAGSESGLDLERNRPYRTDSCSIRATGGSPPSASLDDITRDEIMDMMTDQVSGWLSSLERDGNNPPSYPLPHKDNDQYWSHQYAPLDKNYDVPSKSSEPPKSEAKPLATFLTKLYVLLERPENHHMIRWDPAGEHIIVERPEQLALHVLPSLYGQSRFASFSRHLNIYGFMRKVNLRNIDPAIDDPDASTWSHPTLNRYTPPEVVANFKRRGPPRLPKLRKRDLQEQVAPSTIQQHQVDDSGEEEVLDTDSEVDEHEELTEERQSNGGVDEQQDEEVEEVEEDPEDPLESESPVPIPVPNLTKKSRGRRVPTMSSLEDLRSAASGAGRKRRGVVGKGARMYLCEVEGCGKCFARGEHLKRHVRSMHTYEKPHRCLYPGCGKDFSRHDNLGQHMRVHKNYVQADTATIGSTTTTTTTTTSNATANGAVSASVSGGSSSRRKLQV